MLHPIRELAANICDKATFWVLKRPKLDTWYDLQVSVYDAVILEKQPSEKFLTYR